MNEKIQELMLKSGIKFEAHPENIGIYSSLITVEELENFTKLVIEKCAMVGNYAHDGGEYPGSMIKEYFGLKNCEKI